LTLVGAVGCTRSGQSQTVRSAARSEPHAQAAKGAQRARLFGSPTAHGCATVAPRRKCAISSGGPRKNVRDGW